MVWVQGRPQRSRAKLTATQKAERRKRQEALTDAIDIAKSAYAQEAAHISETHGRCIFSLFLFGLFKLTVFFLGLSNGRTINCFWEAVCYVNNVELILGMPLLEPSTKKQMKVWVLFIFYWAITNKNLDLEKGEQIKLTWFIADNKTELIDAHSKLTFAEKRVYNMQVLEARQQTNRTAHVNPKATSHAVNASFASMDREVSFHTLTIYKADFVTL